MHIITYLDTKSFEIQRNCSYSKEMQLKKCVYPSVKGWQWWISDNINEHTFSISDSILHKYYWWKSMHWIILILRTFWMLYRCWYSVTWLLSTLSKWGTFVLSESKYLQNLDELSFSFLQSKWFPISPFFLHVPYSQIQLYFQFTGTLFIFKFFSADCVRPVSYTHLDVYKRQDSMQRLRLSSEGRNCKPTNLRDEEKKRIFIKPRQGMSCSYDSSYDYH